MAASATASARSEEHRGAELPGSRLEADDLAQWRDRHVRDARHRLLEQPAEGFGIPGGLPADPDEESPVLGIPLLRRHVIEKAGVVTQLLLLDVLGDADDRGTRRGVGAHLDAAPNW